jgi:MFS family permease
VYWLSVAVSNLGDGLGLFGFPILVESLTKNSLWIALIYPVYRLPWVIAAMIGGFVDRCDARTILIRSDLARAMLLLGLIGAVGLGAPVIFVFVAAIGVGTGDCFFGAAVNRMIPRVVAPELLAQANGRIYATIGTAEQVGGYALGGPIASLGASVPLILDGFSFLASALLLRKVPHVPPTESSNVHDASRHTEPFRSMFQSSLRWIRLQPGILTAAKFTGFMSFTQGMQTASVPVFVRQYLRLSPTYFGLFVAAIGIGTIGGSAIAPRVWHRMGTSRLLVAVGVVIATMYVVAGLTQNFVIAGVALFVEAIAVAFGIVCIATLHMQLIPDNIRGRVGNTLRTLTVTTQVLGGLLAAGIVRFAGVSRVLPVAGMIAGFGVLSLIKPLYRNLRRT